MYSIFLNSFFMSESIIHKIKWLFLKIAKVFFIILWVFMLIWWLAVLSAWDKIYWITSIIIWVACFPYIYVKVKELLEKNKILNSVSTKNFWKFYSWILFVLFFIGILFSNSSERSMREGSSFLVTINTQEITNENSAKIEMKQKYLDSIMVNDQAIQFDKNVELVSYDLPLEEGENTITFKGSNKIYNKEFTKTIKRLSDAEYSAYLAKIEEEKVEKERQQQEEKLKLEEQARLEQEKLAQEQVKKDLERINKELDWAKNYNASSWYDSVVWIQINIALFHAYASIIEEYSASQDPEIKIAIGNLRSEVTKLQIREFPKLRKAYAKIMWETLWTSNIEVITRWSDNWTIELVWGMFADNQNKLDVYTTLKDMLVMLRFNRINMKWYEYDDDYTYWDIESKNDNEIVK